MRPCANAFSTEPGRCYRWIHMDDVGRPIRCPGDVKSRGWWKDYVGRWWMVDSRDEHRGPVRASKPGGARVGVVQALHGTGGRGALPAPRVSQAA
jgi:hypothetical protein